MVGDAVFCNYDLNTLLSSPVTPLETFQEWPHFPMDHDCSPSLEGRGVKKRKPRELLCSHADCRMYTHGCAHSVGLKVIYLYFLLNFVHSTRDTLHILQQRKCVH